MFDIAVIENAIRGIDLPARRPRPALLYAADELPELRERAAACPAWADTVADRTAELLATAPGAIDPHQAYVASDAAVRGAELYMLTGEPALGPWLRGRIDALLAMDTWFCHVHVGGCRVCDHVMCNIGAHIALVHDLAADIFDDAADAAIAAGLRRQLMDPFLDATSDPVEWWYAPTCANNWKIMCCGETGLAVCGYVDAWPDARELLLRTACGVVATLDLVPAEGDWGEGPGYWFTTLHMGLRYARALHRLTDGAVDLFAHPALQVTGDFMTQLTTPSGLAYNFGDGNRETSPTMSEALAMLAEQTDRPDWRYAARLAPAPTPLFLACGGDAAEAQPSPRRAAAFPTSGATTLRTGWGTDDVFVGFRSGPSAVSHSHLDANSFTIEAKRTPIVVENDYWPQAHFLGFFDNSGPRWNFDGPGTIGHSTLLVDGQGQTYGPRHAGRLLTVEDRGDGMIAVGDAAAAYPGLLEQFVRTILLLPTGTVVIRDVVTCVGERHVEWLLQHAGTATSDGAVSRIATEDVTMTVHPFRPDRGMGWRCSDVRRTSHYQHSDSLQMVQRSIQYRSFSAFRAAARHEFLFGFQFGDNGGWEFTDEDDGWRLATPDGTIVTPDGKTLAFAPKRTATKGAETIARHGRDQEMNPGSIGRGRNQRRGDILAE